MIVVEDGRKVCTLSDLPPRWCAHCMGHTLDPAAAADALAELDLREDPTRDEQAGTPAVVDELTAVILARRSSPCRLCPQPVEVGDRIVAGDEGTVHATCVGR